MGFTWYNNTKLEVDSFIELFKSIILTKEYEAIREDIKNSMRKKHLKINTPDDRYTFYMDGPYIDRITMMRRMDIWIRDNKVNEQNRTTVYELKNKYKYQKFKDTVTMLLATGYYSDDNNNSNNNIQNSDELATSAPNVLSAADEIMKYKELLDMGIITQEEFDVKKEEFKSNVNLNVKDNIETNENTEAAAAYSLNDNTVKENSDNENGDKITVTSETIQNTAVPNEQGCAVAETVTDKEDIAGTETVQNNKSLESDVKEPFRSKTWFVILVYILFPPLGMYLMFKYKKFSKKARTVLLIIGIIYTVIYFMML